MIKILKKKMNIKYQKLKFIMMRKYQLNLSKIIVEKSFVVKQLRRVTKMKKNKEEKDLLQEIIDIIVETLEVDEELLAENTRFADLDVDSLDLVNLVVAFEKKYNFEIPDNEIKNLQTIKDVVDYVERHVQAIH